jgi:hypothetical protein
MITNPPQQLFGDAFSQPPSAILIPANTLVWANFRLNGITNYTEGFVTGVFILYPFPGSIGASVNVEIYANGVLNENETSFVPDTNYKMNASLIPSATSPNSIFALTGMTPGVAVSVQSSTPLSFDGTVISIAFLCNRGIWLAGWTQDDKLEGSNLQYGDSVGQLAGTYEAVEPANLFPPNLIPQATTTLTFEIQVSGELHQ